VLNEEFKKKLMCKMKNVITRICLKILEHYSCPQMKTNYSKKVIGMSMGRTSSTSSKFI